LIKITKIPTLNELWAFGLKYGFKLITIRKNRIEFDFKILMKQGKSYSIGFSHSFEKSNSLIENIKPTKELKSMKQYARVD
jgi:hypothetical protein